MESTGVQIRNWDPPSDLIWLDHNGTIVTDADEEVSKVKWISIEFQTLRDVDDLRRITDVRAVFQPRQHRI